MSLWKVPDTATAELMQSFYRRVEKGIGPADALREAQLELKAHREYEDPFFWAAFICQGEPGPPPSS